MTESAAPPTIAATAVQRWQRRVVPDASPWLHEEVARRMEERLQWIRATPGHWVHWQPLAGGVQAHALLRRRYPQAACTLYEEGEAWQSVSRARLVPRWWQVRSWGAAPVRVGAALGQGAQLLWANMALHASADPQGLIRQWHEALSVDGFLMFSALGPDTLRELRALYAHEGWGPPGCDFTDMHDWGDMLVRSGFAEPVMDMERLTLTFATAETLLAELRPWGRNVHPGRFPALRGRHWRAQLIAAIEQRWPRQADGRLGLTLELVYGHALKSAAGPKLAPLSTVSVEAMREMLQRERPR
jgi:malonyl-CoA O-methyltransferase